MKSSAERRRNAGRPASDSVTPGLRKQCVQEAHGRPARFAMWRGLRPACGQDAAGPRDALLPGSRQAPGSGYTGPGRPVGPPAARAGCNRCSQLCPCSWRAPRSRHRGGRIPRAWRARTRARDARRGRRRRGARHRIPDPGRQRGRLRARTGHRCGAGGGATGACAVRGSVRGARSLIRRGVRTPNGRREGRFLGHGSRRSHDHHEQREEDGHEQDSHEQGGHAHGKHGQRPERRRRARI